MAKNLTLESIRKGSFSLKKASDIPNFLLESIKIIGNRIELTSESDSIEICPIGSVIGYEKNEKSKTGYICYCILSA